MTQLVAAAQVLRAADRRPLRACRGQPDQHLLRCAHLSLPSPRCLLVCAAADCLYRTAGASCTCCRACASYCCRVAAETHLGVQTSKRRSIVEGWPTTERCWSALPLCLPHSLRCSPLLLPTPRVPASTNPPTAATDFASCRRSNPPSTKCSTSGAAVLQDGRLRPETVFWLSVACFGTSGLGWAYLAAQPGCGKDLIYLAVSGSLLAWGYTAQVTGGCCSCPTIDKSMPRLCKSCAAARAARLSPPEGILVAHSRGVFLWQPLGLKYHALGEPVIFLCFVSSAPGLSAGTQLLAARCSLLVARCSRCGFVREAVAAVAAVVMLLPFKAGPREAAEVRTSEAGKGGALHKLPP